MMKDPLEFKSPSLQSLIAWKQELSSKGQSYLCQVNRPPDVSLWPHSQISPSDLSCKRSLILPALRRVARPVVYHALK